MGGEDGREVILALGLGKRPRFHAVPPGRGPFLD
jgi:hypothetical protein